jgi:PEP-CTERM motif
MNIRTATAFGALSLFLASAGTGYAGTLTTVNDTSAADLANALTTGGAGGITITGETLSGNSNGVDASSGTFSTVGTNGYGLQGSGIVISNGDAATDGTTGPFQESFSVAYGVPATASEANLLNQVSTANSFNDVTELDITFTAGPDTTQVFFNTVFASAEYPVFVGQFVDGFGLFLNGVNIAFAGSDPVNIDNPGMVNTGFPIDGGNDGSAFQTTPLGGVLVENGSAVITYGGNVIPGSTNTLTFIVADANDSNLDTAAFIQGLGNAPPPIGTPEPSTWAMMLIGFVGLGYFARRKAIKLRAVAA